MSLATEKLAEAITNGRESAGQVVARVLGTVPKDQIVKAASLRFAPVQGAKTIEMAAGNDGVYRLHSHALAQVAERGGAPSAWIAEQAHHDDDWRRGLVSDVLSRLYEHSTGRHLVRSVEVGGLPEVRGFLSDRFRRLDSRPVLDAFITKATDCGAVPYSGHASDVRWTIKALLPTIHDVHGEAVTVGIEASNSDFGAGTLAIRSFLIRLVCLNGATREDAMRQVHLGGKLGDSIEFSNRTYALDTSTTVSAVRDVVAGALAPGKLSGLLDEIKASQEKPASWAEVAAKLAKSLTKDEIRRAKEAFDGPDVVNLPPGNTMWRASNSLSWLAHSAEGDRKLELEKIAGSLLAA